MGDDGSWRTSAFRQSVVSKIDEAIRQSGMNTSRNSIEMENHVFQKAKTKEEYLGYVARLILHVREMNTKKGAGMGVPGNNQGGPGMPDPINALQNLATQGSRNQIMNMGPQQGPMGGPPQITASNLLQTLNRGPGQTINMQGGMQPRPPMVMGPGGGPMGNPMGPMGGQIPSQIANQLAGQMANNQMNQLQINQSNQLQNQLANQMQGNVGPNQMGNQMGNQLPAQLQMGAMQGGMGGPMGGQMQNQMMGNMQQAQQGRPQNIMMTPNAGFPIRNPTPNQFLRQSPSPSVQSPAGLSGPPPSNQMVASPALAPSPSSQMSLLGAGGPPRSVSMAPSPGSSLNTPGQPNQSPMGMQDEQAYREKVRQLSKYIEPLRKMCARMGNDGEHEKLSKMKKLLEILSNPQQRMPLETLIKCEVVLEKLDFKRSDGSVPTSTAHLPMKEHHVFNPLLEAINQNLQSPVINHTLHRTFGPSLEALFGPEIRLVPPLKKLKVEEPTSDIPDVLQGELARLDQRFKVSLDPNQKPGSKAIQLTCWLDDKQLPCVPPISLKVPEDYPKSAPSCHMAAQEYTATQFLSAVQDALESRVKKLPKHFSVAQLLDTWEMSVRQASARSTLSLSVVTTLNGLIA